MEPRVAARSRRPRLVFVNRYCHPDHSATSQILYELGVRLVARGVSVSVVCSRQLYENPSSVLPARECIDGIEVHRVFGTRFGRQHLWGRAIDYLSFYVTAAWRLLWVLRRGDVLVAKTDPPMLSVVTAPVAWLRGAIRVNWLQDVFPEVATALGSNPLPRPVGVMLRWLRDLSLRVARMNVVLGDRMREVIAARGVPDSRLCVIPNWADDAVVRPLATRDSALRASLGLGEDRFVVGYSGNLGRAHDYRTLLGAARALAAHRDIEFLVIGGGVLMQKLRREAERERLPNVRFLPYQPREQLADSMAAADVHLACLVPSLEGLIVPSKFYGILAAGRPVVFYGDPNGELAQVIRRADCGCVAPLDVEGRTLAAQLLAVRGDPLRVRMLGENGHRWFLERHTADAAAQRWYAMLEALGVAAAPDAGTLPPPSAAAVIANAVGPA